MITHDTDVVSTLRLAVANRIGQERFELWFGTGAQLIPQDGRVCVEVPNQFTLDWLRNNFRSDIEAAVRDVLKGETAVEFRVNPNLDSTGEGAPRPKPPTISDGPPRPRCGPVTGPRPRRYARRRYASLDTFVVGNGNRVAQTAAGTVVRQLGALSPLFLYGPTGVGKSHLLEGILSSVRQLPESLRLVYLSAEQFTSFFLEALQGKGLPSFRRRYRDVDLLIVDDVQFLIGKRATQAELLHTVDALLREGRQLVFAADRPPSQLVELGTELVTRFSGGLVCAVQPPDHATRLGMLESWVTQRKLAVPSEVLGFVASRPTDDARQLLGALNRIQATSQALDQPIDLDLAADALHDLFEVSRQAFGLADVERVVCDLFHVDRRTLKSNRRAKSISQPRMLAMWLARKYTRAALSEIGDYFGRRSHATVISAKKTVDRWVKEGASVQLPERDCHVGETIRQLEARLRAG